MRAIALWICCCAYLNSVGWALSALHQLNAGGYAVALGLGIAALLTWKKFSGQPFFSGLAPAKLRHRFRHGFPCAFLVLAFLAFLGGALYAPANYDALAYREPRVLHWLAAGQWHWIEHTDFQRLNTRTSGFEWLTAPIFLFTGSDRLVFLINLISFLLLPGRFFAVLTRLGVRPRAAWHWMWLFPTGYGYVLQAGSVANDMFGGCLALTAFEYALRASRQQKLPDLWMALLAAGAMTSAKAYNLMLLLPWAIAILPAAKLGLRRPGVTMLVAIFAASASLLPTAILNWRACHDWTGLAAEQPRIGGSGKPYRFLANAINLPLDNLVPPVFPFNSQWSHLVEHIVPPSLATQLRQTVEPGLAGFELPELQVEESAGLGMGLTLVLLMLLTRKLRAGEFCPQGLPPFECLISPAAWACLAVFMMQVGSSGPARYLLAFYPLLIYPLLTGKAAGQIFHCRAWRRLIWTLFGLAALLLVLSPARPLWPATSILHALRPEYSGHKLLQRVDDVYTAYAIRANGFDPIIAALPADANTIGFLGCDEPETGLWRPFGSRRVVHFRNADTAADLRSRGLKYGLVSERTLSGTYQTTAADWLERTHATVLRRFELRLLAHEGPQGWLLVQFQ